MLDGIYWCIFPRRYARRGLLELLDAAARQAHHGAPLHLEHEQLGPAVQEGRQAAGAVPHGCALAVLCRGRPLCGARKLAHHLEMFRWTCTGEYP